MNNASNSNAHYPIRYPLTVSEEMDKQLMLLLEKQPRSVSRNELIRTAIQQFIEDQKDTLGNHQYSNRAIRKHMDMLDNKHSFYFHILIYLVAAGLAAIIRAVTNNSQVQASDLIKEATDRAINDGLGLDHRLEVAREQPDNSHY